MLFESLVSRLSFSGSPSPLSPLLYVLTLAIYRPSKGYQIPKNQFNYCK